MSIFLRVSPLLRTTTSACVPLPRTSTPCPSLIPDVHNVAMPLPSDRSHQCALASIASPSLSLQEPQSPTLGQVFPDTPRKVLRSLPSVSSHARCPIMVKLQWMEITPSSASSDETHQRLLGKENLSLKAHGLGNHENIPTRGAWAGII